MGFLDTVGGIFKDFAEAAIPALASRAARKLEGAPRTGRAVQPPVVMPGRVGAGPGAFVMPPLPGGRVGINPNPNPNRLPSFLNPGVNMAIAMPGGAPLRQANVLGGLGSVIGGGLGALALTGGGSCPSLFRPSSSSVRPASLVIAEHPETGAPVFFKNAGRPILFSSDLSAAKRVNKLAMRARRGRR